MPSNGCAPAEGHPPPARSDRGSLVQQVHSRSSARWRSRHQSAMGRNGACKRDTATAEVGQLPAGASRRPRSPAANTGPGSGCANPMAGKPGGASTGRRRWRRWCCTTGSSSVRPATSAQHGIYSSSPPKTPPRPRDSARPVTGSQHSAPVSALSSVKPSKAWAANRRWPVNCAVTMFLGIAVTEALALIGLVAGFIF